MTDTEQIAEVVVAAVQKATAPLLARCEVLAAQVAALEARAPVPGPAGERGEKGEPGAPGPAGLDGRDGQAGAAGPVGERGERGEKGDVGAAGPAGEGLPGKDGIDGRDGQPGVPGVPGRDGAPGERGEKGLDGAPGRDGTLEGATVNAIDERTFEILRADGSRLGVLSFPVPVYRGVYIATTKYAKGDSVTFGGSLWIAREATDAKPGEGATAWQLAVKAGRDGREGKPGPQGLRGAKGDPGEPGRDYR